VILVLTANNLFLHHRLAFPSYTSLVKALPTYLDHQKLNQSRFKLKTHKEHLLNALKKPLIYKVVNASVATRIGCSTYLLILVCKAALQDFFITPVLRIVRKLYILLIPRLQI
jgi:hypothetical protein